MTPRVGGVSGVERGTEAEGVRFGKRLEEAPRGVFAGGNGEKPREELRGLPRGSLCGVRAKPGAPFAPSSVRRFVLERRPTSKLQVSP
jgi:hypothetical protein